MHEALVVFLFEYNVGYGANPFGFVGVSHSYSWPSTFATSALKVRPSH
jgi:hypothetical protein